MDQNAQRKDDIQKRLDSLPPEIKQLLYSNEVDVIVQQIGAKNKLHLDQTGILLAEMNEVMMGYLEASDLAKELVDVFRIDEDRANAIAKDVDDMLFSKIRDAMRKVYEEANTTAPIVEAPAPSQSKLPPLEPRSTSPQAVQITTPVLAPVAPTPTTVTSVPPVPAKPPAPPAPTMAQAETMLSQKTVEVAPQRGMVAKTPANSVPSTPTPPPTPGNYKKDPYREPAE
jgi:hypothetical protein